MERGSYLSMLRATEASLAVMEYCQRPFRLVQEGLTICGRGYSGSTLDGLTCFAHRVLISVGFIFQPCWAAPLNGCRKPRANTCNNFFIILFLIGRNIRAKFFLLAGLTEILLRIGISACTHHGFASGIIQLQSAFEIPVFGVYSFCHPDRCGLSFSGNVRKNCRCRSAASLPISL